jgi:hypothetical protein
VQIILNYQLQLHTQRLYAAANYCTDTNNNSMILAQVQQHAIKQPNIQRMWRGTGGAPISHTNWPTSRPTTITVSNGLNNVNGYDATAL